MLLGGVEVGYGKTVRFRPGPFPPVVTHPASTPPHPYTPSSEEKGVVPFVTPKGTECTGVGVEGSEPLSVVSPGLLGQCDSGYPMTE